LISAVVLVALPNPVGSVLVICMSLPILGEGIGLITNWRGGRAEVVRVVRGSPTTRSYVAVYLGKAWFMAAVLGPALVTYALLLMVGAARFF
jgi:hypothetical protein